MAKEITYGDVERAARAMLSGAIRDFKYNPSAMHFSALDQAMRIYQDMYKDDGLT